MWCCLVIWSISLINCRFFTETTETKWRVRTITGWSRKHDLNTLRLRQNGRHFADDIFKGIFLNENVWNPIKFSLKGPINNIPELVQITAWRRPGDKPSSELMIVSLPTHISLTRPQWVKHLHFVLTFASNCVYVRQHWFRETFLFDILASNCCSSSSLWTRMLRDLFVGLWWLNVLS